MGHALPDCIGITKVGEDDSEYGYLQDHKDELVGESVTDGWFTSRWLDDSGAMYVLSQHREGYWNGSAHFNGTESTILSGLEWIEDTVYVMADVLDAEGHLASRLCAAFGQFPYCKELDSDRAYEAVITGLARKITVYATADAFHNSADGDKGPLAEPVELPGGPTMDRLRFGVGNFIPTGMFGSTSPMASFSGQVDEAFAYTVTSTDATVHVARVTVVDCLTIYVCWPQYLAPVPLVGNIIQVSAYLTAFMPALWSRSVDE